jgi:hypothetical protein
MNCSCWKNTQQELVARNLRLTGAAMLLPSFTLVPVIATEWRDPDKAPKGQKRRPPAVLASHCPFCGQKIEVPSSDQKQDSSK